MFITVNAVAFSREHSGSETSSVSNQELSRMSLFEHQGHEPSAFVLTTAAEPAAAVAPASRRTLARRASSARSAELPRLPLFEEKPSAALLAAPPPARTSTAPSLPRPRQNPPANLAEVFSRIEAWSDLPPLRQRDMHSALRRVTVLARRSLADIPASPKALRDLLAEVSPATARLSPTTRANLRSLVLAALNEAGVATHAGRSRSTLSPSWQELDARLPTERLRLGLSRLLHFLSEREIEPADVSAETFERFRRVLEEDSLLAGHAALYRATTRFWNQARVAIDEWPRVKAVTPSARRTYALGWGSFPVSFQADANGFLDASENKDVFSDSYAPSIRPGTVAIRRKQIPQLASALVLAGVPTEEVVSLATLVRPDHAKRALRYLLDRRGGGLGAYLGQQAQLLLTIARHWVKAPREDVETIDALRRKLSPRKQGLTARNRDRLRQFDDPDLVRRLLDLGDGTFRKLARKPVVDRDDAMAAMYAVAVEILLVAPIRVDNLCGLDLHQHLLRPPTRRRPKPTHLVLTPAETKTGVPFEVTLPARTTALLDCYRERFHRLVAPAGSSFLFPNKAGDRRNVTVFAKALSDFIRRETGLVMHIHLFRHLACKLHTQVHPDDVETPRRLLGHKTAATTLRNYAEIRNAAAFKRYDEVLQTLRTQPNPDRRRPSNRSEGRGR